VWPKIPESQSTFGVLASLASNQEDMVRLLENRKDSSFNGHYRKGGPIVWPDVFQADKGTGMAAIAAGIDNLDSGWWLENLPQSISRIPLPRRIVP
jgi:hypothetical protein